MKEQFLNLTGLTELVGYLKTSIANHKEILPYASNKLFPSVGDINTIYIDTATNTIYRWDSSSKTYITLAKAVKSVAISEATENGKITLTVDGNKTTVPIHGLGSAAYTNSSAYSPAGHTHTKAQVGLGNVDNTADANKSVKHAITADSATTAGTATNVSATQGTNDVARHVWFSDSATETKRAYSDKFKYNPVTNNLTANITGNAATASSVAWGNVTGKPSTYAPSAHNHDDSTITSLNASKLFGTIDIARLPHGALERCVIVEDDTARFALTTAKIQLGDTVKVTKTQKMYFVINESKLNSEEGYTVYTAGTATSVPWSGVTGKPTTFTPSSHTHPYLSALSVSGKTITYTKGDGTTGTITTQDTWRGIQNNLTSTSTTDSLSAAQGKILKGLVDGKLSLSGGTMTGNISYKGSKATYEMIKFIDNSSDTYGNGIAIGGGGLTIIGGGESSDVIKNAASSGGEERLVLANDGAIEFYTNCQDGIDKSVHTTIDNTGLFSGIASSANLINCTQLTNQDLNTLKDPGKFYYAAGSNSCTNTGQASGTAFGLYVGRNAEGYRYQKMITTGNLIYYRTYNSTSWSVWSTNIDSTNYTSYAPTKTGTGASGTWGISVTGNAATATKLATARSINGTNFDGSGNITTATWGTARNVTIGNTKKSVNGSADVSWSLSEIGAAAASHTHSYLPLAGGTMSGALNFANNTWNVVGDDVAIGDMNIGGKLGIMGKNGNTGIKLVQNGASTTSGSSAPGVTWVCTGDGVSTMSGTLSGTFKGNLTGNASSSNKATQTKAMEEIQLNKTAITTYLDINANVHRSTEQGEMNLYRFFAKDDETNYSKTYGLPAVDNHALVFSIDGGTAYERIIDLDIRSNEIYTRAKINNSWGGWVKLLNSSNYSSYAIPLSGSTVSNPNASNFSLSKAMTGNLLFANTGDTNGVALGIGGVNGGTDGWTVRGYQTANNRGCLEIAVGDDGDEGIYVRQYTSGQYKLPFMNKAGSASGLTYREIVLMEPGTGNSIFPGTVTATTFKGSLSGNASSATALTSSAGSATQPVYFSGGKPVACTYTLAKSVPADAKFTDTNTWRGVQNNLTSTATDQSLAAAQGKTLNEKKMGAVSANGFYGMARPDGNTSDWIRTTTNGIIPVQSGGRGSGHSALGTDSWYFSKAYVDHVYSTDVKIADKVTLQYDSANACLNFVFS